MRVDVSVIRQDSTVALELQVKSLQESKRGDEPFVWDFVRLFLFLFWVWVSVWLYEMMVNRHHSCLPCH